MSRKGSTGVMYLCINFRAKWKCEFYAAVTINGKQLVVWRGDDFETGTKVAHKIQELMARGKAVFLDWYDNDREEWLENLNKGG